MTWFRSVRDSHGGLRVTFDDADELRSQFVKPWPLPPVRVPARTAEETAEKYAERVMRARKATIPILCGAIFNGEHRSIDTTEAVTFLGLDIDTPTDDPAALLARVSETLGGVEATGYTTASSEPGAFYSRAFVPLDRPGTVDEHAASWAFVARLLARHGVTVDPTCKDPSRGFYVAAMPDSGAYWHGHIPGAPWPIGHAAEVEAKRIAREREKRERETRAALERRAREGATDNRLERARLYLAKCDPAISGSGGSNHTFTVAAKIVHGFDLTEDETLMLMRADYNPRCQPPWNDRDLVRKVRAASRKSRDFVRGSLLAAGGRP